MKKLLLILKLPPPVHGSTVMNTVVKNSLELRTRFSVSELGLSISKDTEDIGKWSIRKIWTVLSDYIKLIKELRTNRPDLIYFAISPLSTAFIKDSVSVCIIKFFKVPILFHIHVKGLAAEYKKALFRILYKYVFRDQYIITLADSLLPDIAFLPSKKNFILPNGITESIAQTETLRGKDYPIQIVFLSNFIKSKGIVEFLLACGEIKRRGHIFRIVVIGKEINISLSDIKKIINDQNLTENLKFLGSSYGEEKVKFLLSSHIFIFPSYYDKECLPLVLLEAMQCGLSIITSSEGAIPSIVKQDVNGILINPLDPSDIANAAIRLINSPDLLVQIAETNRREFKEKYTLSKFENKLTDIIDEIFHQNVDELNPNKYERPTFQLP